MADAGLGNALTSSFAVSGGQARFHERGLTLDGAVGQVVVRFAFPDIGKPEIAVGTPQSATVFGADALTYVPGGWNLDTLRNVIGEACAQRLALRPTGHPGATPVPLQLGAPQTVRPASSGQQATLGLPSTASLQERQLYDVAVRDDQGQWHAIAPHALYFRSSWSDFGVAHVTDLHISRRIDYFRQRLEELGRPEAAQRMYNWNDRVRGFVKYANRLHADGVLDLILATGDFIDYLYETGDDPNGGGNALFARQILLGQAPGPHFPDVEELRVPIFITAGNHDYRKHPYSLAWELDLGPKHFGPYYHYSGFHLTRADAIALNGGVRELSRETAKRPVEVDTDNKAFGDHLARERSYAIQLGPHRIVMLDSSWDVGIVTATLDGILSKFDELPEDKMTFLDGTPNSEGIGVKELKLAVDTLAETPDEGLFILGIHAPLFNLWHGENPPFLRETQRAANESGVLHFLWRHDGPSHKPEEKVREVHPTWFPSARDHRGQRFVKRGDTEDMLDYGASRGGAGNLLRQLAGLAPARRPADLVLQGHIHTYNEFRLGREGDDLVFYTDYYTHNPSGYYPYRFVTGGKPAPGNAGIVATTDASYVEVEAGSPPRLQPTAMPYKAYHSHAVAVPPYPDPLATTNDVRGWWARHRPLILQSGPLAPLDNSQVSFTGFRLIAVKNNLIDKIHFASMEKLQAGNFAIAWEELIRPDPPRRYVRRSRSAAVGAPNAVSAPAAYLAPNGVHNIVYRAANGHLYEAWRDPNGASGYGDLSAAAGAPAAAGNPFVYLDPPAQQQIVLFRGADKHIHSLYWTTGAPGHDNLSGSARAPAAAGDPVAYFTPATGIHHVFYRKGDGHLHVLWWQGQGAVSHSGLTADAGAPAATGTPSAFLDTKLGENVVCYRAGDGHIHTVYWIHGGSGHDNLSGYARAPQAAGDPFAFYTPHDDAKQVTYRAGNGRIYELYWVGSAPVRFWDVSGPAGAPAAASDPVSFYHAPTRTKQVIYRATDGHVIDLSWTPGGGTPSFVDLSVLALAPPGADKPSAYSGPTARHATYRTSEGFLLEIEDRAPAAEVTVITGFTVMRNALSQVLREGRAPG